ncbi:MAG: hypothetical protein CL627_16720 [Aurantimonas sp.]|nr:MULTISPECIES: hypothetical protein [Aurantimonas]MAY29240.1 hypothetical protein [Aurantimonas sp.]MAY30817.1 hypothetical protein [Aurantimonas sp.]MBC6717341.1 hypothetical protein [Aurantimonas sp. DM33-3]MCC4296455.1 hypothetical protein [Aurantimonas coralicida]MCD1643133.1 hypothetical protein [Aurantimonas coralicida]
MDMPRQAKPQPRNFMQELVGRQWAPTAEDRSVPEALRLEETTRPKRRRKKADGACLRQLMTFSVG